ncbi:ECF transporter S component [Ileibacterium valens]|uniref:ECF transporter S component n=1 Tax=Ileibacterium valens TaxID=1862668 RepID=UPI0025736548|nr:ECF transporter S component [Ileibacterium valens]
MSENAVKKPLNKGRKNREISIAWISRVSILAAIAFILMLFEIPLPIAPSFYKMGLDEVAVMIAGFAMGPWAAAAVEALKIILNLLFNGTSTAGVGELTNFILGMLYVLPAAIYYQKHKNRKGALVGLLIGSVSLAIWGALLNYFVSLPMYSYFFGLPLDTIIEMGGAINPLITNRFTFCLYAVLPFNLIKAAINSAVVLLIYKRVSPLLHFKK